MKTALITGITGQDGSYLAELLLKKGYEVYGMYRRTSTDPLERIQHIKDKINLRYGDLIDSFSMETIVKEAKPDEVYNLAAMSQVGVSFKMPHLTREVNFLGVERLLNILKNHAPKAKFYQASTSEMFGNTDEVPQSETTPFKPVSPYGESKVDAHVELIQGIYRKQGMFTVGGILFNHESPRRGIEFVTRKITDAVAKIKLGMDNKIVLGNINAKRDWGYAADYVKAMWLMLQQEKPDDFVIATGETHSVKDFLNAAFAAVNMDYEVKDLSKETKKKADEIIRGLKGGPYVVIHPEFFRPNELHELLGDPTKAKEKLGWVPETKFDDLVKLMVKSDLELLKKND